MLSLTSRFLTEDNEGLRKEKGQPEPMACVTENFRYRRIAVGEHVVQASPWGAFISKGLHTTGIGFDDVSGAASQG
jgi:hypothetical protein